MRKTKYKAFHGSLVSIDEFSYEFTYKGTQALGSGFYFTTLLDDALYYTGGERPGYEGRFEPNPTVHTAILTLTNPLPSNFEGVITQAQAQALISLSPDEQRMDGLWNWGDLDHEGEATVLKRAAKAYAGPQTVLNGLHSLANDFYGNEIQAFNDAVHSVLGYDGVIHLLDDKKNYHFVAWFPSQVEVIKRQPAEQVRKILEYRQDELQSPSP